MKNHFKKAALAAFSVLLTMAIPLRSQSAVQWQQDIATLVSLIETHHPMPWERVSKEDFMRRKGQIEDNLRDWRGEKITVELMKLVAGLLDGHTEIQLDHQAGFNLWFPVRMEKFYDGIFITATDEPHQGLLGAEILKFGNLAASEAYRKVAEIVAKDSEIAARRLTANYLPNAVILKVLGLIDDEKQLRLEILDARGKKKSAALPSAPWRMQNNWTYNRTAVPTNSKVKTIYDDRLRQLPRYLAKIIPSRMPYWFEFLAKERLLFMQFNNVVNWRRDPFTDFTKRLFKAFDENSKDIDKFVIDLRFNEGGNGYILGPFVQEFILRRDALPRGKLYIITGASTFSAAPNLIGQMLKQTSAITVGDIASGPLNWCSDVLDFVLPHSGLDVKISSMFWMTGHAMDKRGCYPPDCYLPQSFQDYVSWTDKPLEMILAGRALPLKDILVNQGWEKFKAEFDKRKASYPDVGNWFPYTPFDLVLTAYFDLLGAGKGSDALELARFNLLLHPDDLRSLYGLAEIASEQENTDLALPTYEKLLALEPHLADIRKSYHGLLLMKAFDEKGTEALSELFKELSKSSPQTVDKNILNNLGYQKFGREKTAAALEIFRLNVALHPDYANGYDSLGEVYVRAGDRENAIRAYQKALELDARMVSAKEALEKLLEKKR